MTQDKPTELTPEEIVAMSDIIDKHYPNSDYVSYSDIRAMMFEYAASLNRQGCRWTKASERLPEKQKQTVLKHVGSGILYLGNADWNDEGVWLFIQSSDAYRAWTVDDWEANLCNWEWLDESIEPCATSSENYWKQRLLQEFKELNVYFNDLFHHEKNQVKDAGHLWIDFSDKFRAFERLMLQETESTTGRIAELEAGIIWALKNPQSVFVFNELRELVKNNPNL